MFALTLLFSVSQQCLILLCAPGDTTFSILQERVTSISPLFPSFFVFFFFTSFYRGKKRPGGSVWPVLLIQILTMTSDWADK